MPIQTISTFTNGQAVSETNMNQIRDGVNNLNAGIGARVYNSAAISVANSDANAFPTFNSERYDTDAFHSTSVNTNRLTIPAGLGGYYLIGINISWAANGTGERNLALRLNGTTFIGVASTPPISANETSQSLVVVYQLAAGDYVEARAFQNSGGALNVVANGNYSPEFWMHRL